ncbi:MAG TPA: hypothetical protein QF804_10135 [Rhodospirillales bacterium]|nr:hypothetical protein [Rhodospirillales bacterium]
MASYDLSGRRILVVDGDEAFGAWAEEVLLGAKAAEVRRARTGSDAAAAIADFAADLVLLELPADAKANVGFMGQFRKAGSPASRALVVPMAQSAKPETLR